MLPGYYKAEDSDHFYLRRRGGTWLIYHYAIRLGRVEWIARYSDTSEEPVMTDEKACMKHLRWLFPEYHQSAVDAEIERLSETDLADAAEDSGRVLETFQSPHFDKELS